MDVIIIGGGVLGLLTARELNLAGARVCILERQALASESSWAGGGILSPLYPWRAPAALLPLVRWSQSAYPVLAADLKQRTGIDPEWIQSGLLVCDCEDSERALGWCAEQAADGRVLTTAEFAAQEPDLAVAPHQPLLLPGVAQIRNPRLLRALRADLAQRGVGMLEHHEVVDFDIQGGRIESVLTGQGAFKAEHYVVASGAWSALIGRLGGDDLPIEPVKGQMLVFDALPDLLRHIVLSGEHYLIPRRDGKILAGSTVEYCGFDKSTTPAALEELTDFAHAALPPLKEFPIEKHWAGLRPGSPEGIPFIATHPRIGNLHFNCGHFRNGFVMAPASARLMADLILGRRPIVPAEPYCIKTL